MLLDQSFERAVSDIKSAMQTNPDKAVTLARAARAYAAKEDDVDQQQLMTATADWLLGEAYIRTSDAKRAQPFTVRALKNVKVVAPESSLHGDILLSDGGVAAELGDVAKSLSDYTSAYGVYRKNRDQRGQAKSLILIAMMYYDANDWDNALKYSRRAIDSYAGDPGLSVSIYNNRGNVFKELGKYDAAATEYGQALRLAEESNSPILAATVLNNAARSWLLAGDVRRADQAIAKSIRLTRGEAPDGFLDQQRAVMAQSAVQHGDFSKAVTLVEKIFRGADLAKTTLADREAHHTAYEAYRATGRTDLALAHLAALKRLDDDATTLARSNSAALMGARFDFANQEVRLAKLKAEDAQRTVAFERARVRTQQLVFLGLAIATLLVIGLLAIGLITIRRSRNQVRAANIDLETTNSALGKALAAKTEFLATTSHEIRTPLNGILGMTQVMLADPKIAASVRDRVNVVHGAGVTMKALVDDILDVAKMETGNLTIEHIPFDLCATVTDTCRIWQEQAQSKGLRFTLDVADCPAMIVGDAGRIRQVVFNLLSNAVKFTATGKIQVSSHVYGADRYRIVVADTGIGIDPCHHEAIFESFRQADAGTTRQFGGTGLGLSICRSIARAMDGNVLVESRLGAGAVFTLDLPLIEAELVAVEKADTTCAMLIVDRNPITAAMLKALLSPHVPEVEHVPSIDAARARLASGAVSGVLIDEGTLRAAGDPLIEIETLVVAGRATGASVALLWPGDDPLIDRLATSGLDRLLAKPIGRDDLVAALFATDDVASGAIVSQAA